MQTRDEFRARHVLLEPEPTEVNSGCPQCGGVNSSDCHVCRGRTT
jgi:predicted RNA-binding Zn-ribbon protein involved in translation (DUF1610 family)